MVNSFLKCHCSCCCKLYFLAIYMLDLINVSKMYCLPQQKWNYQEGSFKGLFLYVRKKTGKTTIFFFPSYNIVLMALGKLFNGNDFLNHLRTDFFSFRKTVVYQIAYSLKRLLGYKQGLTFDVVLLVRLPIKTGGSPAIKYSGGPDR